MKKEIIKINKINKAFCENPVLIDLDFSVYDNDVIYIKGENGCGKSTLLKVICGLLDIDSGSVESTLITILVHSLKIRNSQIFQT